MYFQDTIVQNDTGAPEQEDYGLRVLRSLRRIIRAVDLYSHKLSREFSITLPQMFCLHTIKLNQPLTLSQLAWQVHLGTSTVNGIVDRLELKGFVKRERSRVDRRKVFVTVTEAGHMLIEAAPSLLQEEFIRSLATLPETEQATIAGSLDRVVGMMETEVIETSPHPAETYNSNPH